MTLIGIGTPARAGDREAPVKHPDFDPSDPKQVEQLKIAAQTYRDYTMATERLVRSRGRVNWRYLRVHLLAVVGIEALLRLSVTPTRADVLDVGSHGVIALLLVNVVWGAHILSITRLAGLKYRVIEAMETVLPFCPQTAEWELAGRGKDLLNFLPRWLVELALPAMTSLAWIIAFLEVWLR